RGAALGAAGGASAAGASAAGASAAGAWGAAGFGPGLGPDAGADSACGADSASVWGVSAAFLAAFFAGAFLAAFLAPISRSRSPCSSFSRRTTGASTVEDADFTYSPISLRVDRTTLLSTPSSRASSWTLTATLLLQGIRPRRRLGSQIDVQAHCE